MPGRLEGKVAVITGGASGMGRSTVLRFLQEGACVVVADMNDATGRETLDLAAARGAADRVRLARTDVSNEADVEAAIALATSAFGRLDCVFDNTASDGAFDFVGVDEGSTGEPPVIRRV